MEKALLAVVAVWAVTICFEPPAAEKERLGEAERDGDLLRIDSFRDNAKSPRLRALFNEMHERWKDQDADLYGSVVTAVLGELGNQLGRERAPPTILDDKVIQALPRKREMSLMLHEPLLRFLNTARLPEVRQRLGEDAYRARRRIHAVALLETVALAERTRDESWDPEDRPYMNLAPPEASGMPSGVAPEAIKDPKLRAIYERDLENNRKKAERHRQQLLVRRMEPHFYNSVRRRLAAVYSAEEITELSRLCDELGVPPAWREKLLEEVRQNSAEQTPTKP